MKCPEWADPKRQKGHWGLPGVWALVRGARVNGG